MVHLRIVVPVDRAGDALDMLEATPSVCNIISLPGAARRPDGDVILCDIPREAASIVIADLRDMGVTRDGSIAIENVDTELSRTARAAERAAPGHPGNAVVWEEVEELTSESTRLTAGFVLFMALATIIAAVGILVDSPLLIIGAMVLGPELGPLAALCVALLERRPRLAGRSFLALAVGFPVAISAAFVATLTFKWTNMSPEVFTDADHSFSNLISSPDAYTVVIAFCAGIAGMLSLTTAKSGALTGVLISVTTIPAAANIGVSAAYADWDSWIGSQAMLAINLSVIVLAGVMTLTVQRWIYDRRRATHLQEMDGAGVTVGGATATAAATSATDRVIIAAADRVAPSSERRVAPSAEPRATGTSTPE